MHRGSTPSGSILPKRTFLLGCFCVVAFSPALRLSSHLKCRLRHVEECSNTLRVFQAPIFIITPSATPARRRFRAAVLRRSSECKPGTYATSHALPTPQVILERACHLHE